MTTPEVLAFVTGKTPGEWDAVLAELFRQCQPKYQAIYPTWFPELVVDLPVRPIYSVKLPARELIGILGITVARGSEMVVHQLNWAEGKYP